MKKINYWWVLFLGIFIVLIGVILRIDAKTVISAALILLGIIIELLAVYFLIRKAVIK